MSTCINGNEVEYCARCRSKNDERSLEIMFKKEKHNSEILLILREYQERDKIKALVVSNEPVIREINFSQVADAGELDEEELINNLINIIKEKGFITFPTRPLTNRELTDDGPTHCYKCKKSLSFDKGSLMCTECRSYVCRCGNCMCGYPGGKNYQGNWIPEQPCLKCSIEDRLEYTRIAYAIQKRHRTLRQN